MDFINNFQDFHLLRPAWLLALFPLAFIIWIYIRSQSHSRNWASVIDKRLLPHLLQGAQTNNKSTPAKILFTLGFIIIVSLGGPVFEKRPQSVFKTQSALVIALDLSLSMDSTDIKPSRLSRAHFKINDILKQRKEGQTALLTYAANAYIVSPLTDDTQTIISQIPALETSIMPHQGSRLDLALEKAEDLLSNSGHSQGNIFIISDSIHPQALKKIRELRNKKIRTSVLAIGTEQGAPISKKRGGFIKDSNGAIVLPKLDVYSMKQAAATGGGQYSQITAGDQDINRLLSAIKNNKNKSGKEQLDSDGNKFKTDTWHEEGPWLLLLVIPFAAYVFRKGLVFIFLLYLIPIPQPAQAGWSELWNNDNQLGVKALAKGETERAAELFTNPEWKAAAQYKSGQFQQSADLLSNIDTAEANYNRGNALTKAGKLDDAINAYERALELDPEHEDAKYNRNLVEQARQKDDQDKSEDNNNSENSEQQNQKKDQSNNSSEQKDSQNQEQSQENNQTKNNDSDNKQESTQDQNPEQQNNSDQNNNSTADKEDDQSTDKPTQDKSRQQDSASDDNDQKHETQSLSDQNTAPDLSKQKTQQWLKKIPDDPGGLLRKKFKYQYGQKKQQPENEQW